MNIAITFRHSESTEALKAHVNQKVSRLQKFLRQPMSARVTLDAEKLNHRVEIQIQSGGQWYEAHETLEDMYAAIDSAVDKLEAQIRHAKGVQSTKRRRMTDLRHEPAPAALGAE